MGDFDQSDDSRTASLDLTNLELARALERLVGLLTAGSVRHSPALDRLVFRDTKRILFVKTSDIDYIESEGNYVRVHVGKAEHFLRESIGKLHSRLDGSRFVRIHRSTLVNVNRIAELRPRSHGEYDVVLECGKALVLSRSYRDALSLLCGEPTAAAEVPGPGPGEPTPASIAKTQKP